MEAAEFDEEEGRRSRASLIGLERLRGRGGRFNGADEEEGGRNEPRKRVRKVPGCDELLEVVSAVGQDCVRDIPSRGLGLAGQSEINPLETLRLVLFFLDFDWDPASNLLEDLGRDRSAPPGGPA